MNFKEVFWENNSKSKEEKENQETIHFQTTIHSVLHERGTRNMKEAVVL